MSDHIYQGIGGWWHRDPSGDIKSAGPFLTEELARAAYQKATPKKVNVLESDEPVVAKLCEMLRVPMPDMDTLESFVIKIEASQPVRVIQTFIAQEKSES